jgi:hypothetical protein
VAVCHYKIISEIKKQNYFLDLPTIVPHRKRRRRRRMRRGRGERNDLKNFPWQMKLILIPVCHLWLL